MASKAVQLNERIGAVVRLDKMKGFSNSCVDFFGRQAERWMALYQEKYQFRDRLALFTEKLSARLQPPARVLDFGCGPGVMSIKVAQMGYEVVAVDAADRMIEVAERERRRCGVNNVTFSVMEASSFSFEAASFDAVICSSVLEYLDYDMALLGNLARVLKPKGVLLLSIPHKFSILGRVEDFLARIHPLRSNMGAEGWKYSARRYIANELVKRLCELSLGSFERTFFEIPVLGKLGIPLSRVSVFGLMLLISAVKEESPSLSRRNRPRCQGGIALAAKRHRPELPADSHEWQ